MDNKFWCEHHQCEHNLMFCHAHSIYYCRETYRECPAYTGHYLNNPTIPSTEKTTKATESKEAERLAHRVHS